MDSKETTSKNPNQGMIQLPIRYTFVENAAEILGSFAGNVVRMAFEEISYIGVFMTIDYHYFEVRPEGFDNMLCFVVQSRWDAEARCVDLTIELVSGPMRVELPDHLKEEILRNLKKGETKH